MYPCTLGRTTTWIFPLYSSRWHDMFSYGQLKTEFKLGKLPFRPYVSARFIGDKRMASADSLTSSSYFPT